jgi:hypothetical protein
MGLVALGMLVTTAVASISLTSASISAVSMASTAPAPQVIAWASFLGEDGPIGTTSQWSSGEAWNPLVGTWVQVNGAAVTTRSTANSRAVATLPTAGSSARVIARIASLDGNPVQSAGVVAAAGTTGTRIALACVITVGGSLEIRRVSGGGAASTLLASSGDEILISPSMEISLQIVDGIATASARSLGALLPEVVLQVALTPTQIAELSSQTAYGLFAPSTTNVAFTALRVEWPA